MNRGKANRIIPLVLALSFIMMLAGCSARPSSTNTHKCSFKPGTGTPLFAFLDDPEVTAFAEGFETNFPEAVSVTHYTVDGGKPYEVADEKTIRAVFEALSDMTVLGECSESAHTDDDLFYQFFMDDGDTIYFEFQSDCLMIDMRLYHLEGFDALWTALPYPYELRYD